MADAEKARGRMCARMATGVTVAAMVFAAAPGAFAAPHGDRAPIVFASADAPAALPPSGTFDDSISSRPIPVTPRAPSSVVSANTGPTGAIDLRPGAAHAIDASFGPAVSSVSPRPQASAPLVSKPSAPASDVSGYATPYAGAPYQVAGKWYVPAYEPNYDEVGIASWYGPTFHGKASASGETFDEMALTAAHPTLPIPSIVRVTNLENGKTTLVRVNDRGPFVDNRIIDLSRRAGEVLGLHEKGTAKVRVQYVGPAPEKANSLPKGVQTVAQHVELAPRREAHTPALETAPVTSPREMPVLVNSPATLPSPTPDVREVAPAATPVAAAGFALQAGSFGDPANAEALKARLSALGPVSVVKANVNGRNYYRVVVGPWATRSQADDMQNRLMSAGYKAIVVASGD
ncbi:MAG: septal ring lytic transglycosylase RlpA family protein [Alphaproteobacteria bacterium]|nr:septal ring lytic transglycosylase RlpA family protein [Alphaproteobacteria bacterium]